ncbi:MAG: Cysteine-tRNA ligase [Candidatus Gottesmanbacteria bacterium GW2011_GWA2_44_17]|uniref:Cysteine--tRNA ligase n=1 Tax=Candidatus Gottesmanbacteria bacterium GW2011_GWA2_44_17 TaxID=1618444 RepID=A0A0G1KF71_9BACT|nr:MAG: Cysteine-tRNA ligase [Candidatus Gottesmanbacteria bacterium GW2011_GWA2_44_17]
MLQLYNTLTRKKDEFVPIEKGKVRFYHCGPTVYWTQHIGNLRGMMMGDLLVRTLRYLGYEVIHVRNYTDVGHMTSDADTGEDKMEKGVKREKLSPKEVADKYILQFEQDTKALNLLEPTNKPRATQYVPQMIEMVGELLKKGYAYTTDLAVYFDVSKFSSYTELNKQDIKKMKEGAGKAEVTDPKKKSPLDFALWFFKAGTHKDALQTWSSPFFSSLITNGEGFPGWHIECSAMSRSLLGNTIDIHLGGIEHIPVHHTNEIAQSEASNGVKFVNYWLHNGHLLVNEGKMAKSEGTGYALSEIIKKGYEPLALRYFFLTAQYRSQQNFTWEALRGSQTAFHDLREMVASWKDISRVQLSEEKLKKIDAYRTQFTQALENDLNIPAALAITWEVAKSNIPSPDKYDLIMDFDRVLGLNLSEHIPMNSKQFDIPEEIQKLLDKRNQLRIEKKFIEADAVRKQIKEKGFVIEDSFRGSELKKK